MRSHAQKVLKDYSPNYKPSEGSESEEPSVDISCNTVENKNSIQASIESARFFEKRESSNNQSSLQGSHTPSVLGYHHDLKKSNPLTALMNMVNRKRTKSSEEHEHGMIHKRPKMDDLQMASSGLSRVAGAPESLSNVPREQASSGGKTESVKGFAPL